MFTITVKNLKRMSDQFQCCHILSADCSIIASHCLLIFMCAAFDSACGLRRRKTAELLKDSQTIFFNWQGGWTMTRDLPVQWQQLVPQRHREDHPLRRASNWKHTQPHTQEIFTPWIRTKWISSLLVLYNLEFSLSSCDFQSWRSKILHVSKQTSNQAPCSPCFF